MEIYKNGLLQDDGNTIITGQWTPKIKLPQVKGTGMDKLLSISETIHQHMARYSEELQQKLADYNYALATSYKEAVIDVMRTQIKVLEARMDTLRDLDEDVQKIIKETQENPQSPDTIQ
jgi:cob(I)alamin adenosyltransferase